MATKSQATVGRWLRVADIIERVRLSRSSIHSMVKAGNFPAPVRLSTALIAWREEEVARWLADREKNPLPQSQRGGDLRTPEARAARGLKPLVDGRAKKTTKRAPARASS